MKNTILFLLCASSFVLTGCSKDELTQDAENEPAATKAVGECSPCLKNTYLSVSEVLGPNGTCTSVDWTKCTVSGHNHAYTLNVTGDITGTYYTDQPPITIPYSLRSGCSATMKLQTNGKEGVETIQGLYMKSGSGIIESICIYG